jgi:hypothetical protein
VRLTVTYSGFTGESVLLESLFKRATTGESVGPDLYKAGGMLAYVTNECRAPWQTEEWREQMRETLRPNAYLRLIENRWVTSESSFVEMAWWDGCVDSSLSPVVADPRCAVWVGVDASIKRDSTAIVCTTWDEPSKRVRLIWHRIFQPSPTDPLDFEATIEKTLLELRRRFDVREIRYDPFQLVAVAQRLTQQGLRMVEFQQTVPHLTEASTNLYEIIKGRNLMAYEDADIRLAISRAVAKETSRGWRISKESQSHRIDVIVALAMAALGAVQEGQIDRSPWPWYQALKHRQEAEEAAQRPQLTVPEPPTPEPENVPEQTDEDRRNGEAWWRTGQSNPPPPGYRVVRVPGQPVQLVWVGRELEPGHEWLGLHPETFEQIATQQTYAMLDQMPGLPDAVRGHFPPRLDPRRPAGIQWYGSGGDGGPVGELYRAAQAKFGR